MHSEQEPCPEQSFGLFAPLQITDNNLIPYPGQIGNGEEQALLSSNADGIHSVGSTFGPIIERNTLANMGDDAISVHGMFFLVVKVHLLFYFKFEFGIDKYDCSLLTRYVIDLRLFRDN